MFRRIILVGLLAVAALGASGSPVAAKSNALIVRGHCSGATVWKLKLSPDSSRIEVEFQVDQNRNYRLWRVALTDNATKVWHGSRFTRAPSGSFTVHRLIANRAGADRIVAKATNARSGEVCRASVTAHF